MSAILQTIETPNGQFIAAGDRVMYYAENRWQAVTGFRRTLIRNLRVAGDTLWVGSLGEIGRFKLPLRSDSRYEPVITSDIMGSGDLWELEVSIDGLVACSKDKVWFINPSNKNQSHVVVPNSGRLILLRYGERLLVTNSKAGIRVVRNNKLEPFENPLPDKADTGWQWCDARFVLTTKALYEFSDGEYRRVMSADELTRVSIIARASRWGPFLAVSTTSRGVALFNVENRELRFLGLEQGLPNLYIYSIMPDSEGRLWVNTSRGIVIFEAARTGWTYKPSRQPSFAVRHEGLFVAYEDGAEYFRSDHQVQTFTRRISRFLPTPHGPMFGSFGWVQFGEKLISTPGNLIGAAVVLPSNDLLIASGERFYHVEPVAGRASPIAGQLGEITSVAQVGRELWAVTRDGSLQRGEIAPPFDFRKVSTVPPGAVRLHRLNDKLLISSDENAFLGLGFRPLESLANARRLRVADNADGVWLLAEQDGTNRLGRVVPNGDSATWEVVPAKGINQLTEITSMTGTGHALTICTDTTILELNTEYLSIPQPLPSPRLAFTFRDSTTGNEITSPAAPTALSAEANSLAFSGTISFDEFVERPRFERRLLPTETSWVPTKLGEVVSYPSLSSRTYTLEVRSTHLGRTGAVVAHKFTVLPPWYATRAATAGYLALAGLGFFGLYRLRTHQLRKRTAELERIVEERTHALKEASKAKTEFLASMSHEIRNPMNGVIGLVNILREQPATSPKQAQTLRLLQHCADQLRSTVDDILDFSRIEAGKLTLETATFDLRDTLEAAAVTIDQNGATITFLERPPPGVSLIGDVGKLRQIFANYLSNALKYGVPPGARVSTLLTPTAGGVRLTVGVASSGPTIPKDTLDKFFDTFTRGTEAIERNIHGTGLGLAICRKYAVAMGGEVGAVSANGETTFYLNLPFARAGDTAPATPAAKPPGMLPAKALAIEDEDYNRIVLGNILAKMNYTVDWATTGAEALKLARENGYDIILTDYRLPDTNGVELTKKILAGCPDPKPAVFAVTAYSTKERKDECLHAGMSGFISKPITLEKLRSTLAGWGEKNLAKISLESSRMSPPALLTHPPPVIAAAWTELTHTIPQDPKRAAALAHRLNNLCRAHELIDAAEQLELLEGALERGEPAEIFVQACEEFLRG